MKDKKTPAPAQELELEQEEQAEEVILDPVVEKLKATEDQLLRLAADFDNFRKRSQREKEETYLNAKCKLLGAFLPVMDNFERACGEPPAAGQPPSADAAESGFAEYRKGVEMILSQFADVFAAEGAESFGAAGEAFDPNLHNAVLHIENPELGEGVIAEVFSKGWKVGEKLIREATVGVAN